MVLLLLALSLTRQIATRKEVPPPSYCRYNDIVLGECVNLDYVALQLMCLRSLLCLDEEQEEVSLRFDAICFDTALSFDPGLAR